MRKQFILAVSMVLTILFSSCNKDMTALDPSLFKCNPNPLEVKGGKIDAIIAGKFPVKYFTKNAVVTVTPVLKFNGKELKGEPSSFQGEKIKGNNKVIYYQMGGSYPIKVSFDYVPEMANCELFLDFDIVTSSKTYKIPSVKVADGVISTSQLVSTSAAEIAPVLMADKFQRSIKETQEADILFAIKKSDLKKGATSAADVVSLTQKIKNLKEGTQTGIEVSGYASPEGGLEINTNLAEQRQKVTADFLNKELKKVKQTVTFSSKFTAEDWAGFQALMEKSNIQDKELILRVLTMYSDPEERERQIRNLSVTFKSIADQILPQLRRSRMRLTIDVVGKSDAELTKLAKEDASKLSVDELLFAATLTSNLQEKSAIYQKVTELFPTDVRGFNNLGATQYQLGKMDDAARYFVKALELDSKSADINYNAGITSLSKGELSKAEEQFGKAAGTSGNLNQALGTISVIKGEYGKGKAYLGAVPTNNAALLQILNGDYSGARKTLAGVAKPNGTTSYLGAIIGARINDRDMVYSKLKEAVKLDGSLATKAAKDLEFAKYATEAEFLTNLK